MEIINLNAGAESARANCYLIISGKNAAVVDPGINKEHIIAALTGRGLTLKYILMTHGHFDHTFDLDRLRTDAGGEAAIHALDAEMLADSDKSGVRRILDLNRTFKSPEILLSDGGELTLSDDSSGYAGGESGGADIIRVIHTPGHTRGSVCFEIGDTLITGDTLFLGDVGRCDLYGGDMAELYRSLEKLAALERDYTILPGHGESSSLRAELSRHIEL